MVDTIPLIQLLMDFAPRGEPMDQRFLAQYGAGEEETCSLVRAGWLRRLSNDAYLLRGDAPTVEGTVAFLGRKVAGLHIGGRAALDMQGVRYYVYARARIDLWGDAPQEFPAWASELLLLNYRYERLFDDALEPAYAISPLPVSNSRMPVSAPERAVLEYLAASIQSEMLREDNANLVGMLRNIRLDVLQELADHCVRRDVVWGLKFLGEREDFSWAQELEG